MQILLSFILLRVSQTVAPQVYFQAPVDHIRFDAVSGGVLAEPKDIWLNNDAGIIDESGTAITLTEIEDRPIETSQHYWIRTALNADVQKQCRGSRIDPVYLSDDEVTLFIRDFDTSDNSVLPTSFPFVRIAPWTLEALGRSTFGVEERRISFSEL